MTSRLLLLHLSDIHFQKPYCLNPEMDPDRPVRIAIINDSVELCKVLGNVDAILVTGDIAYHGDQEEYEVAKQWLDEVSRATGCAQGEIYTVPGNHDVDCNILQKNEGTISLRQRILSLDEPERHRRFHKIVNDDKYGPELMEPFNPYNRFAARYDCAISAPGKPFWIHELPLGNAIRIRMYGLTSSIFSEKKDIKGNLYLGAIQTVFEPRDKTINLALMHHPPDWLSDSDDVEDKLWNGTKLHLMGHKHRQRIINDDRSVRIAAGAVNPARNEGNWEPGYNLIELSLSDEEGQSILTINSHLRNWQSSPDKFIAKQTPNGSEIFVKKMVLGPSATNVPEIKIETINELGVTQPEKRQNMSADTNKSLVYRFWDLASSERRAIANKLGLLSEKELELPEVERYKRAFHHAKDRDKVQELSDAIRSVEQKD